MIDSYISSLLTTFIAKRAADERLIQDEMNQAQMADALKENVPEVPYPPGSWPRGTGVIDDPRTAKSVGGASNLQNQQGIQMRQDGSFINPFESTAYQFPGQGDVGGIYGNAAVAAGTYAGIKGFQNFRNMFKPYNQWTPAERQRYVNGSLVRLGRGKDNPVATSTYTDHDGNVKQFPSQPMTPPVKPPGKPPQAGATHPSATPQAAAANSIAHWKDSKVPPTGSILGQQGINLSVTGAPIQPGKFLGFQRSPVPATAQTRLTVGPPLVNALRPGVSSWGAGGRGYAPLLGALAVPAYGAVMSALGKDMFGNNVETNPDGGYLGVLPRPSSSVGTAAVPALPLREPDHAADAANAKVVGPNFSGRS